MTSIKFPVANSYPGLLGSSDWLEQSTYKMELTYVTESIVVLTCAACDGQDSYNNCLKDIVQMLNMKHTNNYMVINLSRRRGVLSARGGCSQVLDQPWPEGHAPMLEQLCNVCRSMDEWLRGGLHRVIALHCDSGLDRVALVLASYINYCSAAARPEQALDRMAMKQFFDEQLGGLLGPSQVRYVRYFSSLLVGQLLLSVDPLYLQHIVLYGVPCFDSDNVLRPFIRIYQNMKPIHVTKVYSVLPMQQRVCFSVMPLLELAGDVLIKCYHKAAGEAREVVFRLQFNTSTVSGSHLIASKPELDGAVNDQRFPDNGRVELIFTRSAEAGRVDQLDVSLSQEAPHDPIVRWDSYEHLELYDTAPANAAQPQPSAVKRGLRVSRYFEEGPLEDGIFSKTPRTGQMNADLFSGVGTAGSGFGVTNVSSRGNVDITIIPPSPTAKTALREQLSPTNKGFLARSAAATAVPSVSQPGFSSSVAMTPSPVVSASLGGSGGRGASAAPVVRVEKSYSIQPQLPSSGVTGPVRSAATAATHTPGTSSVSSSAALSSSSSSSYTKSSSYANGSGMSPAGAGQTTQIPESEQNDLDKILSDLLGDTSAASIQGATGSGSAFDKERRQFVNADGSTTTIERRLYKAPNVTENLSIQKTSYRSVPPAPAQSSPTYDTAVTVDGSGTSWLEQQQQKLLSRSGSQQQRTFDIERPQSKPSVVSEVRIDKPITRSPTVANGPSFTSEREVIVQQQPVAYTVMITPKDQAPPPRDQQQQAASSKKTVTNVNKTVSAHYNFHGSADGQAEDPEVRKQMEDQQKRIAELEERLRALDKKLLDQAATAAATTASTLPPAQPAEMSATDARPPPRPPRAAAANAGAFASLSPEDDDEVLAFRPVGIQNLESSSGVSPSTLPRSGSGAVPLTPTYFPDEEESMAFVPVGMASLDSNPRAFGTMKSQGAHSYAYNNAGTLRRELSDGGVLPGPAVNGFGHQQVPIHHTGTQPGYSQTMESRSMHHTYRQQASGGSSGYGDLPSVPPTGPPPIGNTSPSYAPFSTGTLGSNYGQLQQQQLQQQQQQQQQQSYQQRQEYMQSTGQWGPTGGASYGTLPPQPPASARGFGGFGSDTLQQQRQQSQYKYNTLSNQSQSGYNQQLGDAAVDGWQTSGSVAGGGYATLQSNAAGRGNYGTGSRRGSIGSVVSENFFAASSGEQAQAAAKYVKDMSKFWYKPNITRDEAIAMLRDAAPGTFVVRDSNSFPGAFGLAVKVAQLPTNVTVKSGGDALSEYVRFFLIEPTPKGVRLKGCPSEPTFSSLASLIYQHTVTPLALPVKLQLPDPDKLKPTVSFNLVEVDHVDGLQHGVSGLDLTASSSEHSELLRRGAACNVLYLNAVDVDALSGPQAISRAVQQTFAGSKFSSAIANFKVSAEGITVTDNNRKLFTRQHFPRESIIYCGLDPADRRFTQALENGNTIKEAKIFGFVAKKNGNQCLLFAEADVDQPATAIVNFITRVMMTSK